MLCHLTGGQAGGGRLARGKVRANTAILVVLAEGLLYQYVHADQLAQQPRCIALAA